MKSNKTIVLDNLIVIKLVYPYTSNWNLYWSQRVLYLQISKSRRQRLSQIALFAPRHWYRWQWSGHAPADLLNRTLQATARCTPPPPPYILNTSSTYSFTLIIYSQFLLYGNNWIKMENTNLTLLQITSDLHDFFRKLLLLTIHSLLKKLGTVPYRQLTLFILRCNSDD